MGCIPHIWSWPQKKIYVNLSEIKVKGALQWLGNENRPSPVPVVDIMVVYQNKTIVVISVACIMLIYQYKPRHWQLCYSIYINITIK